jgi:hypothetical protein
VTETVEVLRDHLRNKEQAIVMLREELADKDREIAELRAALATVDKKFNMLADISENYTRMIL